MTLLQVEAEVVNAPTSDCLWREIEREAEDIRSRYPLESIARRPGISATRAAYKSLGKDPNRYRPSAEALCRRVVNGKGLYRLTTLVDLINLVSLVTGYSIGGFDRDNLAGDRLVLGAGRVGEPFEAIGRGQLNISGLPVYRDAEGGIGTPTSDCERTKLTALTRKILIIVNIYGEETPVSDTLGLITRLLNEFACASDITHDILSVKQK